MSVLPRPPAFGPPEWQAWAQRMVDAVQHALDDLARPARVGIVASNVTPPATYNAATATLLQTSEALGTLIAALKASGRTT